MSLPFKLERGRKGKRSAVIPDELYVNPSMGKLNVFLKYVFDPDQWLMLFRMAETPSRKNLLRKVVMLFTVDACLSNKYTLTDMTNVYLKRKSLNHAVKTTTMFRSDYEYDLPETVNLYDTQMYVFEGDCLDVALWFKDNEECRPACLIMGSRSYPGGGYRKGASAQEEDLTRRTNLFECLEDPYKIHKEREWQYPIDEYGGIYIKDAAVFRGSINEGYYFYPYPKRMCFIDVCAFKDPPTTTDETGRTHITGNLVNGIKRKISAIFKIALSKNRDCLILSALGCGAYNNPPHHMAQLFKEVIDTEFAGKFKIIAFAIINDPNAYYNNTDGNIIPFAEVFNVEISTLPLLQ